MREKLTWYLIALLPVMILALHAQTGSHSETQIGRFQIVTVAPGGGEGSQVYRIDTTTGATQVKATLPDGKSVWTLPIQEFRRP